MIVALVSPVLTNALISLDLPNKSGAPPKPNAIAQAMVDLPVPFGPNIIFI